MINLEDYDYFLLKEKIAQHPENKRDWSKLMVITKNQIQHKKFYQITDEIEDGDVIVVNNSKVIAVNLKGKKKSGGRVECLFLREIEPEKKIWECLLKGRRLRPGIEIQFLNGQLKGSILNWKKFGQFLIEFTSESPIKDILREHAAVILPPYVKAPQDDLNRYQTVYASIEGSIAAPTAGLHLTTELIEKIEKIGANFVTITLHVGYSTFMPLNNELLSNYKMDPEYFSISQPTIKKIQECSDQNNHLIAVGTTTLKALESATNNKGNISRLNGWSDLFIAPGYSFKSNISRLVTNFHMPKSSPLLMVCAFAGRKHIFEAYKEAISKNYRFYSFGDAMLVDKE
ncbi:MAG: tRNA preQ1(34) S-adenosylmethionine ribosyltransferase-isomerase QueA [Promethearchaeota archaeon]